jgi:lactoylglutathione lyase/glyoxylase I family protein
MKSKEENKNNEDEIDLFDLVVSKPASTRPDESSNPFNPVETETNIFNIEFDKKAPAGGSGPQVIIKPDNQRFIGTETTYFELGPVSSAPPPAPLPVVTPPQPIAVAPIFTKIAHVCLYVKDINRSIEFYGKMGMKQRFVFYRGGKLFGVYLEFGSGNYIELFEDATGEYGHGRLAHFCFETQNIDVAMQMLTAAGIEYTPKKLGCDATYQIWMKDPDGNNFEVHQYTSKSAQIVGGDVEADW